MLLRHRRSRRATLARACIAAAAAALLAVSCTPWSRFEQIPQGSPGADGPCTTERTVVANPVQPGLEVVIVQPSGPGAPWTGGTCSDPSRPLAVVLHGFGGGSDAVYGGLIHHLVSNGFVVAFARYGSDLDLDLHLATVDAGVAAAVATSGRVDTSRVGVLGHSMGGGMAPRTLQRMVERGWGTSGTWMVLYATWFAYGLDSGPIVLPPSTRVAIVAYDRDSVVDARIGIELYDSLTVPAKNRTHVVVRSDLTTDPELIADHMGPVSFRQAGLGGLSTDHFDRWSAWRTADATAGCALAGIWCDTDLSFVGTGPDGRAVAPAIVGDPPVDIGPFSSNECTSVLNPRSCPD